MFGDMNQRTGVAPITFGSYDPGDPR